MGNGAAKLRRCFSSAAGDPHPRRRPSSTVTSEPYDDNLGHSFCYLRPDDENEKGKYHHAPPESGGGGGNMLFRSISGVAISANASTSTTTEDSKTAAEAAVAECGAAAFESSDSFFSGPLHLCPRASLSGPLDRAYSLSGPLDRHVSTSPFSGPLDRWRKPRVGLRRSLSRGLLRNLSRAMSNIANSRYNSATARASSRRNSAADSVSDAGDVQWAQGKAGEDRIHVVVSEQFGWVFVGIYDGFNGPDATDYLLSHLYLAIQLELKGVLWEENENELNTNNTFRRKKRLKQRRRSSHVEVLKALSMALKKTEEGYLEMADKMVNENPELALMGSCVLVTLMKGEDVYVMNVGDSRAVLARNADEDEDSLELPCLSVLQLSFDHSTCMEEEVRRIRKEHPDDATAIMNDRVKGSLKVTRAFGAGFLKQAKWNDALLEMFKIDYIGNSPYITCSPSLYHHKLSSKDRFLILSSDGLYQYFTNEQAVEQVEMFISTSPDGDPAQHLIEEVLYRAAEKAGMDFHELLEIPHGDRRRYHDDVSIIVISLEGRIWRSCV